MRRCGGLMRRCGGGTGGRLFGVQTRHSAFGGFGGGSSDDSCLRFGCFQFFFALWSTDAGVCRTASDNGNDGEARRIVCVGFCFFVV